MDEIVETEPLSAFARWFAAALDREPDANAMTLATATLEGRPSARAVLLKGFDARGFVFYTNLESRKSTELSDNPQAALCFFWKVLRRQVRIEGGVAPGFRRRGGRLFRQPCARKPARRLGVRPVAPAREPRQARAPGRGIRAPLRRGRGSASALSGRAFAWRRNGSNSGRSGPPACMTAGCLSARATAGGGNGSSHDAWTNSRTDARTGGGPAAPARDLRLGRGSSAADRGQVRRLARDRLGGPAVEPDQFAARHTPPRSSTWSRCATP